MTKDPYKYFRIEARELIEHLTNGVLQLEKGTAAPEVIPRLLRLGHTLKGAARVVRQPAIAELAHTAEGLLAAHRESGLPFTQNESNALLALFDEMTALVAALDAPAPAPGPVPVAAPATAPVVVTAAPSRVQPEDALETVRVDIREMDALLRSVSEANVQLAALRRRIVTANDRGGSESLLADVDKTGVELSEIRERAHRLRLVPALTIFPLLERAVRDAALTVGKRVSFQATGGEIRLDAHVLASLRDPLIHVFRNAVAHGIESDAERVAAGKPSEGRVRLDIERRGSRVAFICRDDGQGVDVDAVRDAAVARHLTSEADARALTSDQVLALLLTGGLTTSRDVTELSGRGIGLDLVGTEVARLKGNVSIRSERGRGAVVDIQVPVSIASLTGLIVEAAGGRAAIPLDAVRQALRVRDADVSRATGGDSIVHDGDVIPFVRLDHALRRDGHRGRGTSVWSAVVVQHDARRVAVGVERMFGTSHVVMQSLPDMLDADDVVAGASLDGDGNPLLVLDPVGLVAAGSRQQLRAVDEAPPVRAPILVIDDSLTTRMLEKSILESAGYDVDTAVSAEDGLAKARERAHSVFVVDVEMPGMSGFEFVALTRTDPELRGTPAILVTSRNEPEDRRRGADAGARAYIVKSEFDQGRLLDIIRGLAG